MVLRWSLTMTLTTISRSSGLLKKYFLLRIFLAFSGKARLTGNASVLAKILAAVQ